MSATLATENTGTNSDRYKTQGVNATSGDYYTAWVIARRSAGARHLYVLNESAAVFGPSLLIAVLNMDTGVITQSGGTNRSASAVNLGGGWWFFGVTGQAIASGLSGFRFGFSDSPTYAFSSWAGDGTSGMVFAATQVEVGTFPSSYIPTTTAAVTRAVDVCLMTGTDFSRWFNPTEGTFLWEFGPSGGAVVGGVGDTFDNAQYFTAVTGYASFRSGGASQAQVFVGAANAGGKVSWAYRQNDFAACYNGGVVGTDTSGNVPLSNVRLTVGSNPWGAVGGTSLFGPVGRLRYYPRRLSNARLQEVTA